MFLSILMFLMIIGHISMLAIMMKFYHLFLLTSADGSPNMFPQQDLRVLVVSSRNLFQTVEKRKRPNA